MLHNLFPISATLRRAALTIAIAAWYAVFISPVNAQTAPKYARTTWTITIDASGPGPLPNGYKVDRDVSIATGCPYENDDSDALLMKICNNDRIIWKTVQPNTDLWVFHHDEILDDSPKHLNRIFHGNGANDVGADVDQNAEPDGITRHEYSIFIYDGHTPYFRDPKIMIGGGKYDALETRIKQRCDALLKRPKSAEEKSIRELCEDIDALENRIHAH
jgi:hypothetical protein